LPLKGIRNVGPGGKGRLVDNIKMNVMEESVTMWTGFIS
jgi:hypothetical protein